MRINEKDMTGCTDVLIEVSGLPEKIIQANASSTVKRL